MLIDIYFALSSRRVPHSVKSSNVVFLFLLPSKHQLTAGVRVFPSTWPGTGLDWKSGKSTSNLRWIAAIFSHQKCTLSSLLAKLMFFFFLLPKRFSCPDRIWCFHMCGRIEPWQRVLRAFQSREKSWASFSKHIFRLHRVTEMTVSAESRIFTSSSGCEEFILYWRWKLLFTIDAAANCGNYTAVES